MSDQDELRSPRDVDVDAERFVDDVDDVVDDAKESETGVMSAVDLPPEGSISDIIDQHTAVPHDDEP